MGHSGDDELGDARENRARPLYDPPPFPDNPKFCVVECGNCGRKSIPVEMQDLALTASLFNATAERAHSNSKARGFWPQIVRADDKLMQLGSKVALIHSEVSELLEAYRKDPKADCGKKFPDAHSCSEEDLSFSGGKFSGGARRVIPGKSIGLTLEEEELADIIIRVLDLSGHRDIDIGRAVLVKMEYNSTRPHKHGKQF